MRKRWTYLEKDKALSDSGEMTSDITISDPITALWVEMRCANGASWNHNNPMHDCVSDIEVIDGAEVIHSLDAQQLLARACADLRYMPHQRFSELGGDPASIALPIMFGRSLEDTEYALDPKRFLNPQVRLKWDLATNQAVGATGYATGGLTATIIAECLEDVPAPKGFLLAKEHYTWTSAAGVEYIDLPRDRKYRGLLYKSYLASYHPYGVVSNVKLNCDGGKYVPLDVEVEDLLYLMMMRQPALRYRSASHLKDSDTLYSHLTELESVMAICENQGDVVPGYANYEYGNQTFWVYAAGSASGSYMNIGLEVHGYCPFGYIYIPFGRPEVVEDWFDPTIYGSVRLEATGAVASGACAVCVVQERLYS